MSPSLPTHTLLFPLSNILPCSIPVRTQTNFMKAVSKAPRRCVVPHREDIFYFQSIESNLPFSSPFLLFPFSSKTFQTFTQEVCNSGATSSILTYHTREGRWELEFCARFSMDQLRMPQLRGRKEPGIELDRTVPCQTLARSVRYTKLLLLARTTSLREAI